MTALPSDPSTRSCTVMPTGFSPSPPRESAHTGPSRAADWWWRAGHTVRLGPTPGKPIVSCWTFSNGQVNRHSEVPIGHRQRTTHGISQTTGKGLNTRGACLNFNRLESL
jgi:hypothetical protein